MLFAVPDAGWPKLHAQVYGFVPPVVVSWKIAVWPLVVKVNPATSAGGGVTVTWHVVSLGSKVKAPMIVVVQPVTASLMVMFTLAPMFIVPWLQPVPVQGWVGKMPLN